MTSTLLPPTRKQEFGRPSLQPSLRCQTHAFLQPHKTLLILLNLSHLSGLGRPAELNNISTDKKVPNHLPGLDPPALLYKINHDKKNPKHLPGFSLPPILYKIDPDRKSPKHLSGLGQPAVFIKLQLIRNIQVIYQDFTLASILLNNNNKKFSNYQDFAYAPCFIKLTLTRKI